MLRSVPSVSLDPAAERAMQGQVATDAADSIIRSAGP
jgi:hypothetical protein